MTATRALDPSISRTPLALSAKDLATLCVLCSHNCGLRVDVEQGFCFEYRDRGVSIRDQPTSGVNRTGGLKSSGHDPGLGNERRLDRKTSRSRYSKQNP